MLTQDDRARLMAVWRSRVGAAGVLSKAPTVDEACERTFLMVPLLMAEIERLEKLMGYCPKCSAAPGENCEGGVVHRERA